jgi:hypothetical protein
MVITKAVNNWGIKIFTYGRGFSHPHSIPGDFSRYTFTKCLLEKVLI